MAIRELVIFPDERLRHATQVVRAFTAELARLAEDMLETMYHHQGVGLAAPQIGVAEKIFVVDVSESRQQPMVFVNPQILDKQGMSEYEEGCLSVPNYYAKVCRPATIQVRAQNVRGEDFTLTAEGLFATCIQHENDHLNGGLFIDYLSKLKQSRAEKKVAKWQIDHRIERPQRASSQALNA